jgi:hypothetical protein
MLLIADSLFPSYGPRLGQPFELKAIDRYREVLYQTLSESGYYGLPLSTLLIEVDTSGEANTPSKKALLPFRRWLGFSALTGPSCRAKLLLPDAYHPYTISELELRVHTADRSPSALTLTKPLLIWSESRAAAILDGRVLLQRLYVVPASRYNQRALQVTQRALQGLPVVQWALPILAEDSARTLKVSYEVLLRPPLDASLSIEGFQSSQVLTALPPLPGASLRLGLTNLSLWRRGWTLAVRGQGFLSYFRPEAAAEPQPLYSLIGEVSLLIPQGTMQLARAAPRPLPKTLLQRSTALRLSYQDFRQVAFSRRYLTVEVQQERKLLLFDRRREEHLFTPFSLIFVQSQFSPAFEADIQALSPLVRSLILRDFLPRLTQISAYQVESTRSYFATNERGWGDFSRSYVEVGGIGPALLDLGLRFLGYRRDTSFSDGQVIGRYGFGLFVRVLGEGRLRYGFSPALQWIGRGRIGLGRGLFYTQDLPFENRFFLGGPGSMRGWQFGSLGPGTYPLPANRFLIPGGEILLEFNTELRWTFYRGLQLAPFIDVGNVWFWKTSLFDDSRGKLAWKNLLPGIASGLGLRWDFSILVLRLDVGQQVYDPATNHWVLGQMPIGGLHVQYHIAIGYPF